MRQILLFLCLILTRRCTSFLCLARPIQSTKRFSVNGAKTGWNHNLPDDSSDFWAGGDEVRRDDDKPKQELRTGWLHNTAPASAQRQKASPAEQRGGGNQARELLELAKMQASRGHRILSPPVLHAVGGGFGRVVTEHAISVLLNDSSDKKIDVYFSVVEKVQSLDHRKWLEGLRERSPTQRANDYVQYNDLKDADRMVLYLQGGPGFGAPSPITGLGLSSTESSWASKALGSYDRVVLMDQRGTGRSTPVLKQTLEMLFPDLFLLDDKPVENLASALADMTFAEDARRVEEAVSQATEYLTNFRADKIVKDAELVREALLVPTLEDRVAPWGCTLGQSFGGFCLMTYLSTIPNPPKICLFTGGIAPMLTPVYNVYSSLWDRVHERNLRYYDMFPQDVELVQRIVRKLVESPAPLPSGGTLTARRFLQVGMFLGGGPAAFTSLHNLVSSAFLKGTDEIWSRSFLRQMETDQDFDDAPIYFWLHESIYCDGPEASPSNWAAHRAYLDKVKADPSFDYRETSRIDSTKPVLFFGEHVFPWMTDDYAELRGVGLKAMAEALAQKSNWGPLFNASNMREALASKSKAAAAVYHEDMFVDFDCCMKVTARGGPLGLLKQWVTNDYQHSGLRDDGAAIFSKLHDMATGGKRTPS